MAGSCFVNVVLSATDTNDPLVSTVTPFVTGGNYSFSVATVVTVHNTLSGIASTYLDLGLTVSGTAIPVSSSMGFPKGFTLKYQALSSAPSLVSTGGLMMLAVVPAILAMG